MKLKYGITLREAIENSPLKNGKILAGHKGLDRLVTQVNIMEVPDIIDWVGSGQLLLTAAYPIKDNTNILNNLIPSLNKKGLAGLAIKLKRYIEEIPAETLRLADTLNFPIIEIPWDIPFPDITGPIMAEIFNKHAHILMRTETIHGLFMDVVLKGRGLEGLALTLGEILQNPVEIVEYIFDATYSSTDNINTEENSIKIPIMADRTPLGYIKTWEINRNLDSIDNRALDMASTVAALEIIKQQAVKQVSSKYISEFVEDILSEDLNTREEAFKRAHLFDFNIKDAHGVMVIRLDKLKDTIFSGDYKANPLNSSIEKLTYILEKSLSSKKIKALIAQKTDTITLVFSIPDKKKGHEKDYSFKLADEINKILKCHEHSDITIGIGNVYNQPYELFKSLTEGKKAVELSNMFKGKKIIHFEDLGFYRLLSSTPKSELIKYYNETVKPLIEYDLKKDTELVNTLIQYFECNGNLKKISEKMYTHYNTILYRIQRIQEITGCNLQNPVDRLNIEIGLKIKSILE